jgi:hypothetical protein
VYDNCCRIDVRLYSIYKEIFIPDTTLRQLKLLECIPRFPFKKTPQEMKEVLESEGFDISERSIQRDLIKLSAVLPLISDERNKPFGWSCIRNAPDFGPAMDPIESISYP